jgi:hypothetical protein
MSIVIPNPTDTLAQDNHAAMHGIVAVDPTAPNQSIAIPASGNVTIAADLYTNIWADYSATSTIVGWASFTTKSIFTKKIGKTVFISFYIAGTSNSTSTTFTVPYASATTNPSIFSTITQTQDNGIASVGNCNLPNNSSTVTCLYGTTYTSWTNSGTKIVLGQLFYQSV